MRYQSKNERLGFVSPYPEKGQYVITPTWEGIERRNWSRRLGFLAKLGYLCWQGK